jgi:hypothetical protein
LIEFTVHWRLRNEMGSKVTRLVLVASRSFSMLSNWSQQLTITRQVLQAPAASMLQVTKRVGRETGGNAIVFSITGLQWCVNGTVSVGLCLKFKWCQWQSSKPWMNFEILFQKHIRTLWKKGQMSVILRNSVPTYNSDRCKPFAGRCFDVYCLIMYRHLKNKYTNGTFELPKLVKKITGYYF